MLVTDWTGPGVTRQSQDLHNSGRIKTKQNTFCLVPTVAGESEERDFGARAD